MLLLLPCLVSRLSDTDDALVADVKARYNDLKEDGWNISTTPENLAATFPDIDPRVRKLFLNAEDIKMWRLYMHEPYPYWVKGRCALLGDAAHPMMPDQSQGACMAIEDVGSTYQKSMHALC